jgi:DNA-binding MltR family transcriptional regulator
MLELFAELESESDRGVAILACVFLDDALKNALLHKMIPLQKEELNYLFEQNGPLSSFANKTALAYSFGIIHAETKENIDRVRSIRNAFAHGKRSMKFDTTEVSELCGKINLIDKFPTPRETYIRATYALSYVILMSREGPSREEMSKWEKAPWTKPVEDEETALLKKRT